MFLSFHKKANSIKTLVSLVYKIHRPSLAILVLMLGITLLGIMGVFIKHLGYYYSPTLLAVARNIFGFIPIIIILSFAQKNKSIGYLAGEKNIILILLRGGSIAVAQFCFYLALMKLEFATASTLVFAGPLFVTALSVPILKAQVGLWRWAAVIIGFFGVLLIMGVGSDLFTIYALLPLGAAFGYALSSVMVKLFDEEIPTIQIQLFTQLITLIAALFLLIFFSGYTHIVSLADFFLIILMGVSGGCGVICLISAYRMTQPFIISPFEYFGIPLSIYLGWAYFEEFPLSKLFPGVFFIILAGVLIIWREKKLASKKRKLGKAHKTKNADISLS